MRILLIQNNVHENIDDTLSHIKTLISSRKHQTFDFLVLPEMFTTPYQTDLFEAYAQSDDSVVICFLKQLAAKYQAYVIGGSVPEKHQGKLYNTTYIFDRKGCLLKKYRKIHLFSITYPDQTTFDEGDVLSSGDSLGVFDTEYGKMGVMVCFDIRYPLLAKKVSEAGAQVIFVPGAFNDFTGPLHWQTTFKARAIDNQLFMVGCSASSTSFGNYNTYGHSLIVDPLGKIITSLKEHTALLECALDLETIKKTRETLPIFKNTVSLDNL